MENPKSSKRSLLSSINLFLAAISLPSRFHAVESSVIAVTGSAAASTTLLLNSSCAFFASRFLDMNLEIKAIAAVIATERPRVKVAINAFAATLEIPKAVANFVSATVSNSFALRTNTSWVYESLFKVLATCCKPMVIAIRDWTLTIIFCKFSFSPANSPTAPCAAEKAPLIPPITSNTVFIFW